MRVRRFFCVDIACPRKTFAELFPHLASRYGRSIHTVRRMLRSFALAVGGRPGVRLSGLGVPTSRMALLRVIDALAVPEPTTVRVLGVNGVAFRRGHNYGPVLVNMETADRWGRCQTGPRRRSQHGWRPFLAASPPRPERCAPRDHRGPAEAGVAAALGRRRDEGATLLRLGPAHPPRPRRRRTRRPDWRTATKDAGTPASRARASICLATTSYEPEPSF